jgi:hypothetical protein
MKATAAHPLPAGFRVNYAEEGEWKITVQVFRDLGIAFSCWCRRPLLIPCLW